MLEWLETGGTVNANRYCDTFHELKTAIKNRRRGMLSKGVIMLQDNARPHVAKVSKDLLQHFRWEVLHHPPYSTDLSPCDFHVFGPLKKPLKGHRFTDNDEVRETVEWFRTQPKPLFTDGIHHLVDQGDTCFNHQGDYV